MKTFLFIGTFLLSTICFSQSDDENGSKSETIITTMDSLSFYTNKYRDISKAMRVTNCKSMRVSYIYLNGKVLSQERMNSMRAKIIADYKSGKSFADLANENTMDNSKDGDLGWFDEGMMVKTFEDEVKRHKKGDIFTVDIPENNWYYVVLKTYDDVKKIKFEITLK